MKTKIVMHDLDKKISRQVNSEDDCLDEVEVSAFRSCIQMRETITIGPVTICEFVKEQPQESTQPSPECGAETETTNHYDTALTKVKAIRNSWDCRPTKALIEWAEKTLKPMNWVCEELATQGFSMRDYWEVKSCIAELAALYKIKK